MTNFYRILKSDILIANVPPTPGYNQRLQISNLRMAFSIQKNLAWSTNSCSLRIWNLNEDRRNILKDYGDQVTISAGYQDVLSTPIYYTGNTSGTQELFKGDTTNVRHAFEYPDILTVIECGDGERYSNQKIIQLSYKENTPVNSILIDISKKIGITFSNGSINAIPNVIYQTGYSFSGMAKDALNTVCAYAKIQWSIQNEELQIIPLNGVVEQPPFVINSDTGMIGIPERYTYKRLDLFRNGPKTGWRVRTTLRPDILPGSPILLQSDHIKLYPGSYRVETIRHEGDNFSAQWFSNIEVTLI